VLPPRVFFRKDKIEHNMAGMQLGRRLLQVAHVSKASGAYGISGATFLTGNALLARI